MGRVGCRLGVIRANGRAGAVLTQAGLAVICYSFKPVDWACVSYGVYLLAGLSSLPDGLLTNRLKLLVLFGRKDRLHLRISLLMDSSDLLHFLNLRKRVVVLDCLHLRPFVAQNR